MKRMFGTQCSDVALYCVHRCCLHKNKRPISAQLQVATDLVAVSSIVFPVSKQYSECLDTRVDSQRSTAVAKGGRGSRSSRDSVHSEVALRNTQEFTASITSLAKKRTQRKHNAPEKHPLKIGNLKIRIFIADRLDLLIFAHLLHSTSSVHLSLTGF